MPYCGRDFPTGMSRSASRSGRLYGTWRELRSARVRPSRADFTARVLKMAECLNVPLSDDGRTATMLMTVTYVTTASD